MLPSSTKDLASSLTSREALAVKVVSVDKAASGTKVDSEVKEDSAAREALVDRVTSMDRVASEVKATSVVREDSVNLLSSSKVDSRVCSRASWAAK